MSRTVRIASVALLLASLFPLALGRWWLGDLLSAGRLYLVAISVALSVGALVFRSWATAALALASVLVNVLVLASLYTASQAQPADARRLVIAHVNMQQRPGSVRELVEALRSRHS